jgi:hypothetical protein
MQTGYQTYNEVLQDNYTHPDAPHLYYDSMFIPPLAPDDFEAIRADMGLTDPIYTTGTDGLGTGSLPYQPQAEPSYQDNVMSVGMNPSMSSTSPKPRSTQQDPYPRRRTRHQGVRHEPYENSRLKSNKRREQYDQSHTMVRDPSDLVFPIVGPESDDINWQAGWSILSYNPEL